jgi:formiminotetrahydrofolate cyclodeaminase
MNLERVMERIYDSKDFTAGGGAASAVSAAMAASLVAMVSRLSTGRELGLSDEDYCRIADDLDGISLRLRDGAVRDLEAFLGIKAAYALPKGTDGEKAARREAVGKAATVAADVPRENARLALQVAAAVEKLEGKSNANAASDLEVGRDFAFAAIRGCLANIRANLGLIKDPERVAGLEEFVREMEGKMAEEKGMKQA